jgi:hypothetical protein
MGTNSSVMLSCVDRRAGRVKSPAMAVLLFWGRGLFVGGLAGLAFALLPTGLMLLFPPLSQSAMVVAMGGLLLLSVAPLAVLSLSVGAILLILAALQRLRSGS